MRILVLSRKSSLYSTQRLVAAGTERGHEMRVIDYLRCYMNITSRRPTVLFRGEELTGYDAIIPRIGASHTFYGSAVVRQFEMAGMFTVTQSQGIQRAQDKLRSMQLLARAGVGMPVTGFASKTADLDGLIDTVGGTPLVIKLLSGTQGKGVVLAETRKAAKSVIEALRQTDADLLVQDFVAEAAGSDVRAFVVGRRVVAAMERRAPEGEFRSNVHQGGAISATKLTPAERAVAIKAARAVGLDVAGVDLMRSSDGPVVLEVNSSPGLEGIEKASGRDVAGAVIEYIEKNARPNRRTKG